MHLAGRLSLNVASFLRKVALHDSQRRRSPPGYCPVRVGKMSKMMLLLPLGCAREAGTELEFGPAPGPQ